MDDVEEEMGSNVSSVGSILFIADAIASVPDKYLLANGAYVSNEEYPELYSKIGLSYGEAKISSDLDKILILDQVYDFETDGTIANNLDYIVHLNNVGYIRLDPAASTITVYRKNSPKQVISLGQPANTFSLIVPHCMHKKILVVGVSAIGVVNFSLDTPSITVHTSFTFSGKYYGTITNFGSGLGNLNRNRFAPMVSSNDNNGWFYGVLLGSGNARYFNIFKIDPENSSVFDNLYNLYMTSSLSVHGIIVASTYNTGSEVVMDIPYQHSIYLASTYVKNESQNTNYNAFNVTNPWYKVESGISYTKTVLVNDYLPNTYPGAVYVTNSTFRMTNTKNIITCSPSKSILPGNQMKFGGAFVYDSSNGNKILTSVTSYPYGESFYFIIGTMLYASTIPKHTISILKCGQNNVNISPSTTVFDIDIDDLLPINNITYINGSSNFDYLTFISGQSIVGLHNLDTFALPTISLSGTKPCIRVK